MIQNYCNHKPESPSPVEKWEELRRKKNEITELGLRRVQEGFLNKLRFWRRLTFQVTLAVSQEHMPFRCAVEYNCVRMLKYAREMYLEIGERMKAKDLIQNREDVFYFSFPELKQILKGREEAEDLEEVILRRKSEGILPATNTSFHGYQPEPSMPKRKRTSSNEKSKAGSSVWKAKRKGYVVAGDSGLNEGETWYCPSWIPCLALLLTAGDLYGLRRFWLRRDCCRELGIPAFQIR
jgi:hypothetical protein